MQKKGVNTDAYTQHLYTYLDRSKHTDRFLFGYFDESNQLVSIMGVYFWSLMPFATLSYMFLRQNLGLFNANQNGLNLCLHRCFEMCEAKSITTLFSLQKTKSFKHKIRTWRKNDTEITKKYFSIPQAQIPAHTMPEYSIIQKLMDYQTWPYDTTLWMTTLKPKYQKKINWGWDSLI